MISALVTGASSGIGKEIALYLASLGYDLYVVSRDKKKLESIFLNCGAKVTVIALDLRKKENCLELYRQLRHKNIDILVNNAGFGDCGNFEETVLDKELDMIDLNIKSYHILMKLFLKNFVARDRGRILNVASMAGFMPGPYMATYYATKAYVVNLSLAVYQELKLDYSNVNISVFCPGPVKTGFSDVANVHFKISSLTAKKAARIAVDGMFLNKRIIFPTNMKINYVLTKIAPVGIILKVNAHLQERASV